MTSVKKTVSSAERQPRPATKHQPLHLAGLLNDARAKASCRDITHTAYDGFLIEKLTEQLSLRTPFCREITAVPGPTIGFTARAAVSVSQASRTSTPHRLPEFLGSSLARTCVDGSR